MNMAAGVPASMSNTAMKAGKLVQLSRLVVGWKKFIPKKPVTNAMGIKSVVIAARIFITSPMRLLITER